MQRLEDGTGGRNIALVSQYVEENSSLLDGLTMCSETVIGLCV